MGDFAGVGVELLDAVIEGDGGVDFGVGPGGAAAADGTGGGGELVHGGCEAVEAFGACGRVVTSTWPRTAESGEVWAMVAKPNQLMAMARWPAAKARPAATESSLRQSGCVACLSARMVR